MLLWWLAQSGDGYVNAKIFDAQGSGVGVEEGLLVSAAPEQQVAVASTLVACFELQRFLYTDECDERAAVAVVEEWTKGIRIVARPQLMVGDVRR
ncbi:hypothetical protein ACVWZZ_004484 [Bradyrhizobium sp. LM6.10]